METRKTRFYFSDKISILPKPMGFDQLRFHRGATDITGLVRIGDVLDDLYVHLVGVFNQLVATRHEDELGPRTPTVLRLLHELRLELLYRLLAIRRPNQVGLRRYTLVDDVLSETH